MLCMKCIQQENVMTIYSIYPFCHPSVTYHSSVVFAQDRRTNQSIIAKEIYFAKGGTTPIESQSSFWDYCPDLYLTLMKPHSMFPLISKTHNYYDVFLYKNYYCFSYLNFITIITKRSAKLCTIYQILQ